MSRLWNALDNLLWPRRMKCLTCDVFTEGELLCSMCASELNGLLLPPSEGKVQSVWAYKDRAAQLIRSLKDQCVADCAIVLAEGMAEVVKRMGIPEDTVLTWVTMPARRRRERGVDHGRLLCEAVAERTGMQARELLIRSGDGRSQRSLSGHQRQTNLIGRFSCVEDAPASVLLIDDVLTTGTTARVCTEALLQGGVEQVHVLTAAAVVRYHTE